MLGSSRGKFGRGLRARSTHTGSDEHLVGGGEGVDGQGAQGGRAVDEDERVRLPRGRERLGQRCSRPNSIAVPARSGFEGTRSRFAKRVSRTSPRRPRRREVAGEDAVCLLTEPGGCVCLRVEVDDERPPAGLGEAGGEVDRRRRLPDPALLVRDSEDPTRHGLQATQARGRSLGHTRSAGKRFGVGSTFEDEEAPVLRRPTPRLPGRAGLLPAPPRVAARAESAWPTYRTRRPPGCTSGRLHSTATGGSARARARAVRSIATLGGRVLLGAGTDDAKVRELRPQ